MVCSRYMKMKDKNTYVVFMVNKRYRTKPQKSTYSEVKVNGQSNQLHTHFISDLQWKEMNDFNTFF